MANLNYGQEEIQQHKELRRPLRMCCVEWAMATSRYDQRMKIFAKRLKAARIRAGHRSAQQFANLMGIEPPTYRTYERERGGASPNVDTIARICQALHITPNELIPVSDDNQPTDDHPFVIADNS